MDTFIAIKDFEIAAKEKMSRGAFDYYAGGAADEITLQNNIIAFTRRTLRPRVLVDVSSISLKTTLIGTETTLPIGVAPAAFHSLAHPDGEVATARAAARAGVIFCASTMSSKSLEEIAMTGGNRWFQLYTHKERSITQSLVERAVIAGYKAIILTVDLPVFGKRERDARNQFSLPRQSLGNFAQYANDPTRLQEVLHGLHDPSLSWRDVAWLKKICPLPLIIKGILTTEDAMLSIEHGADAVWISNHGGRQLDQVPATIDVVEEIVNAVSGRTEIYLDGGIRRGTDVAIALSLGVKSVFMGRPYLYALAANGEEGVFRAIEIVKEETEIAFALLGIKSLQHTNRGSVLP